MLYFSEEITFKGRINVLFNIYLYILINFIKILEYKNALIELFSIKSFKFGFLILNKKFKYFYRLLDI